MGENPLEIKVGAFYGNHDMVSVGRPIEAEGTKTRGQEPAVTTVHQPQLARHDAWNIRGSAPHLSSAWLTAGLGVVILVVSIVLMAHSAPFRSAVPAPHHLTAVPVPHHPTAVPAAHSSAAQGSQHVQPGPVPGRDRGSELRPAR